MRLVIIILAILFSVPLTAQDRFNDDYEYELFVSAKKKVEKFIRDNEDEYVAEDQFAVDNIIAAASDELDLMFGSLRVHYCSWFKKTFNDHHAVYHYYPNIEGFDGVKEGALVYEHKVKGDIEDTGDGWPLYRDRLVEEEIYILLDKKSKRVYEAAKVEHGRMRIVEMEFRKDRRYQINTYWHDVGNRHDQN